MWRSIVSMSAQFVVLVCVGPIDALGWPHSGHDASFPSPPRSYPQAWQRPAGKPLDAWCASPASPISTPPNIHSGYQCARRFAVFTAMAPLDDCVEIFTKPDDTQGLHRLVGAKMTFEPLRTFHAGHSACMSPESADTYTNEP